MEEKLIKAKDLIINEEFTQIRHINQNFVSRYRQNYRNGAKFPPLLVDKKTYKVVSGNHRLTAICKEYGENEPVTVNLKNYSSKKEMLEDFIKENSTHGMPLDQYTKKKLVSAFIKSGGTREEAAKILNVPIKKIDFYGEGTVFVTIGGNKNESRPAKRGFEPPDRKVTKKQWEQHDKYDKGFPLKAQTNQIVRWLKNDLIELNEKNYDTLVELKNEIENYLKRHAKSKAS